MSLPMPKRITERGFYYHYKHNQRGPVNQHAYAVVGVGFDSEKDTRKGEENFLIYVPFYDQHVYKP